VRRLPLRVVRRAYLGTLLGTRSALGGYSCSLLPSFLSHCLFVCESRLCSPPVLTRLGWLHSLFCKGAHHQGASLRAVNCDAHAAHWRGHAPHECATWARGRQGQ